MHPNQLHVSCWLGKFRWFMIVGHKMPNISAGSGGADEDSLFLLGTYETRGNIGIAPSLTDWLGSELGKEAVASKERRKAREERAAQMKDKEAGG